MTIDNRTALDVVLLGVVTVQNINFIKPTVRRASGLPVTMPSAYNAVLGGITLYPGFVTAPLVAVTNAQDGDVRVGGMLANPYGEVRFIWTGTSGGALRAACRKSPPYRPR